MGKLKPVDAATKGLLEPTTPLTPTQAESRRILSHAPDSDPCHRINFEWSMKDLQAWSQAEQEMKAGAAAATSSSISKTRADLRSATFVLAGRVWWSAAGRLSSIVVLLIAIAAESLIVLRDASARITEIPIDPISEDHLLYEGEQERRLSRIAMRMLKRAAAEDKAAAIPSDTDPACHWVQNTDVQNNGSGIGLAVSYHILTMFVLIVLVLAEFKIWKYKLHGSATLNIGIIQVWAGLAGLSRAVNDLFGTIAGVALIIAGLANIVSGFLDRFKAGGPGFALFGTGIVKPHPPIYSQGAVPAQNALPLAQGNAIPTAVVPTNPAFPMPPSPTKESVESEKALKADLPYLQEAPASKKASETDGHPQGFAALFARQSHAMSTSTEPPQPAKPMKAKAKGQARTRKTPLPKQPRSPYSNVGLDDPAQASTPEGGKSDPALDMKPILDNLAASSPEAYMALLTEIARRTSVVPAGVPMPMIEEKPAQIHTYRPASPAASSTVSRHGKIWKNRMAHDF